MEDLLRRIEGIRSTAARFYAVDLHLHSPLSYDWANSGSARDQRLDRIRLGSPVPTVTVEAFREACVASHREIMAVTDHNATSFGVEAAKRNDSDAIVVLPGIEMCVVLKDTPVIRDYRLHVVGVFPEAMHQEAFGRVLPHGTAPEGTRDPKAVLPFKSIDEVIAHIQAEGGIAIAAHVESKNGLRGLYRLTTGLMLEPAGDTAEAREILRAVGDQVKDELAKFDGVQVRPSTEAAHYLGSDGNLRVALIVATDCQKGTELSGDNSTLYSYVKMSTPSFEGLREALKFPDLRVRLKTDLSKTRPPRLLGVRFLGAKATPNTFFDDTVLGFSDNLTCIIGPRGSGKSAAIDGVRYLMGFNRTLDQVSKVKDQVRERQRATLEKTRIEAVYECADGRRFRLVATFDAREDYVTEVYDSEGEKLGIEDVELSGEFPINLYGWGELELLAQNPDTQRDLLDRFIPEVGELRDEKRGLYELLVGNAEALVKQARGMERYFTESDLDFLRVNEFKSEFDRLNTSRIKTVFTTLDTVQARRRALKRLGKELDKRLAQGEIAHPFKLADMFKDDGLEVWAADMLKKLKAEELDDWTISTNAEYVKLVNVMLAVVAAEDEGLSSQESDAQKKIQAAIGDQESITGDLRNRAKERYEKAFANQASYRELAGEFERLRGERQDIIGSIEDCCKRIFATRDQAIGRIKEDVGLIEDEEFRIGLVLRQLADRRSFASALDESRLSFHGNWRAERRVEVLAQNLTPFAFVAAIIKCDKKAFVGLGAEFDGQTCGVNHGERLVTDNTPMSTVEGLGVPRVDTEKLDRLLRLENGPVDDEFFITLGDKPIQNCSPGQRCSAMLPIVTLTNQAPLIIDQPEDNLDNRLVSHALFKILARLKETRQIILATHNPNILVSGDAEQVLLLDGTGDLARHGCIDHPPIVESVIGLMEGGVEAFELRRKRYQPFLPSPK